MATKKPRSADDAGASADDPAANADHVPSQAEIDADKEPLSKDEALQLLKAGHRLRHKGDSPANWVGMTRHSGDLAVSFAATDDEIDALFGDRSDFILAE